MKDMKQPIFVYYELDNFYQNHRRYDVLLRFPDNYLNLSLLHKLLAITFPDVEILYGAIEIEMHGTLQFNNYYLGYRTAK